jgi:hypothetical protein
VYSNPFYVASPATAAGSPLNYSQALTVPEPSSPASAAPPTTPAKTADTPRAPQDTGEIPVPPEMRNTFEAARNAFEHGDYRTAQREADKAIGLMPTDAALHEFRALTLFAQGNFLRLGEE